MDLRFKALRNNWFPERYHGQKKQKDFFEGWYFKMEDPKGACSLALIAGISINQKGDREAFIQYLIEPYGRTHYHSFSAKDFHASEDKFEVQVGGNRFSKKGIDLNLPELKGQLTFHDHLDWKKSLWQPNIMGPLNYWPGLDCYHALVSLRHRLKGSLRYQDQALNFEQGIGYIEKDWGKRFPDAHIWLQCSEFKASDSLISLAIAPIQIWGKKIQGFAALIHYSDRNLLFSPYQLAKVRSTVAENQIHLVFKKPFFELEVRAERQNAQAMRIPGPEGMKQSVKESLQAPVQIWLRDGLSGALIYSDRSEHAALEVSGKWFK